MYIQAPPKPIPRTLETTREPDETIVFPDDEEILQDEMTDEMAPYFNRLTTPKILITGFKRAHLVWVIESSRWVIPKDSFCTFCICGIIVLELISICRVT